MAMFQPADQQVHIQGQDYNLRLTLGGLAEISQSLKAAGPKALSARMKLLTPEYARLMLIALLRPCHSADMPQLSANDLTRKIMQAMALIFEQSFKTLGGELDE